MDRANYVGIGLYTYPEAARIIGVKTSTLRGWVNAYRYSSRGISYQRQPVISRQLSGREPILTFLELVELLFIKLFRQHGVPMHTIRATAERAKELFETNYPFAVKRFDTDGRRIFVTLRSESDDNRVIQDLSKGQFAFEEVVKPFFRRLDYDGNAVALTLWPMERHGRVVLDPHRVFGKPIDAETGVPTAALYSAVTAGRGQSFEHVARWYEVPVAAVEYAVRFERSLSAA